MATAADPLGSDNEKSGKKKKQRRRYLAAKIQAQKCGVTTYMIIIEAENI
jgi:hypothetical protein